MKQYLWIIALVVCTACHNNRTAKSTHELTLANYKGKAKQEASIQLRNETPIDLSTADTSYWFRYGGRINGYEVSVYNILNRSTAALLVFKHRDGTKFHVVAPSFNDQHIRQQNWENNWVDKDSYIYVSYDFNRIFTLSEESDEATSNGLEKSPFFFGDVDFDGEDELITCRYKDGQYNRYNCFECFDIKVTRQGRSVNRITYPPFDYLVGRFTRFDKTKQTIHTWSRDGAYDTYQIIKQGTGCTSILLESGNYNEEENL